VAEEGPLSPYLRRLPIGERLPLGDVANDELFPLEGEILVRRLEPPIIPEPQRRGEWRASLRQIATALAEDGGVSTL
jgi:hypothetical protein